MFTKSSNDEQEENQLNEINMQLNQLTQENTHFQIWIEDTKESYDTNNSIFAQNNALRESLQEETRNLKAKLKSLKNLSQMRKEELALVKREKFDQVSRFDSMPGLGDSYSIQDLLDSAQLEEEMLVFKDQNGIVWEITKEEEVSPSNSEDDEVLNFDPSVIEFC